MYQASVPVFRQILGALSAILDKADAYAAERKIDPAVLLNTRLFPDMFPLMRQVQIACDQAKGCAARLAGVAVPSYEDNETSIAEIKARIAKTLAFAESFTPAQIDGTEERAVTIKLRSGELTFTGQDYLLKFVLPNFYFHATTAYDILRHCGVPLGKRDFLGTT
jgi:hypothetical protein